MFKGSNSFQYSVRRLIFTPAAAIILLLATSLSTFCLYELAKFVDMRGQALTHKIAQLVYTPLINQDKAFVQQLLEASLEEPYVRALQIHLDKDGETIHAGPEFYPIQKLGKAPNSFDTTRNETSQSILYSAPITTKDNPNPIGWVEMELMSSPYLVVHYQVILITISITLFCLLIAAFLAQRLLRNIQHPLVHTKEIINQLALGRLSVRAETPKQEEFAELSTAINNMAEFFEAEQRDLQNHIEQYTRDLRETLETIEIKNVELDIARKEAIEASRIKSEFLANTSHEIRTPLNGILGFVNLALRTELTEKQTEYLQTIRDSAQNLLTVINGILDFSKIEAGKLTLEYAPLPLRDTIDETLHLLAPAALEKNLQLISNIEPAIPAHLLGDSLRLKQVLSNLISNAIKFSAQGDIIVSASVIARQETHLMLRISVSDQGKGLSVEQQSDLFKPFSQTDASSSRENGGTGLGLAICKGLVERMQGEIGVESQLDKGSTFWFTARLGIDKNQPHQIKEKGLSLHRALLFGSNNASLAQLKRMLADWNMSFDTIEEIHDIFPTLRRAKNEKPYELLILDIAPDERKIPPSLLNNLNDQLTIEFNCKLIACCTQAHQRLLRTNNYNSETTFVNKPIPYKILLDVLVEKLEIPDTLIEVTQQKSIVIPARPVNVLLVDDNPANLQLTSELLRGLNTQVVQAANGLQAIAACKEQTFDVIFMDIQMPGMDGFQTTQRIREMEKGKRTPIIALTAHSLTEQKSELLIAGMDDCVSKPISETILAHIINRWAPITGKNSVSIQPSSTTEIFEPLRGETEPNGTSTDVDIQLCLKLANNKPLLARDMLKMMLSSLPNEREDINQALSENNQIVFGELIHRLYGSSCYCGVPRLKHITGLMDKLLQAKNFEGAASAITSLNSAIDDVITWGNQHKIDELFGIKNTEVSLADK